MNVGNVLKLLKFKVQNSIISRDDEALISLINLGVNDLYRRFNLSLKSETLTCNTDLALYELRNPNVQMLLSVYDRFGYELKQSDVLDSMKYDYKILNYRSFILRKPFNGYLYAVYRASHIPLNDEKDTIDLPDAMIDALLAYCVYMVSDTINRDNKNTSGYYIQHYEKCCLDLDNMGYRVPLNIETMHVAIKGYV